MNDESASRVAARRQPIQPTSDEQNDTLDQDGDGRQSSRAGLQPPSRSTKRRKHREGLEKKLQFMIHLQKSLDMLVFAYFCALYYMECSTAFLMLRVIPHRLSLSPKDRTGDPHVASVLAPNLICLLAHVVWPLPQASEASRGYLHGGLFIDFVGQKPPMTRLGLIYIDLAIAALQCLMLAVYQQQKRLERSIRSIARSATRDTDDSRSTTTDIPSDSIQDHDAEERGVLRHEEGLESTGLQAPSEEAVAGSGEPGRMGASYTPAAANVDLVDIMRSGNGVLANFHVICALKTVGGDIQSVAATSLQRIGYTATLAAIAADRRARLVTVRRQIDRH